MNPQRIGSPCSAFIATSRAPPQTGAAPPSAGWRVRDEAGGLLGACVRPREAVSQASETIEAHRSHPSRRVARCRVFGAGGGLERAPRPERPPTFVMISLSISLDGEHPFYYDEHISPRKEQQWHRRPAPLPHLRGMLSVPPAQVSEERRAGGEGSARDSPEGGSAST